MRQVSLLERSISWTGSIHHACTVVAFYWRALWDDRGGMEEPALGNVIAGGPGSGHASDSS